MEAATQPTIASFAGISISHPSLSSGPAGRFRVVAPLYSLAGLISSPRESVRMTASTGLSVEEGTEIMKCLPA
jgi:hypothetical protein